MFDVQWLGASRPQYRFINTVPPLPPPSFNTAQSELWLTASGGSAGMLGPAPHTIGAKSMTVLNPLCRVNEHIMDDADLAGPLIFCFFFATFLLFVCILPCVTFYPF